MHIFQLRLLRSEISQANADRAKASGNLAKASGFAALGARSLEFWIKTSGTRQN